MRPAIAMVSAVALAGVLTACGDAGTPAEAEAPKDKVENILPTDGEAEPEAEDTTAEAETATDAPTEAATEAATKPVACQTGETTLFSCKVASGKTIAVCGKDGNAQYRFGKDNAELTLDKGEFASVPYSGGGEAQIAFSNGDTRYVVFSRTVRTNFTAGEPNNPEFTDGVIVTNGDTVVGEQLCTGEPESVDVMAGDNYGGVADELFYGE